MATHDLTFTDWENYTDGDGTPHTLDWSIASMEGTFPYPYIEAIRQALAERESGARLQAYSSLFWKGWVPALDAPVLGGQWAAGVIKTCIQYLRCTIGFGGEWNWVPKGEVVSLDNKEEPYLEAWTNGLYIGDHVDTESESDWTTAQTKMMDDAGIADATFREWWMMWNTTHVSGRPAPIEDNILFPWAVMALNIKKLLTLLVEGVSRRVLETPPPPGETIPGIGVLESYERYEYLAKDFPKPSDWYATESAFNSLPWTPSVGTHVALGSVGHWIGFGGATDQWGEGDGIVIQRVKADVTIPFYGSYERTTDIYLPLGLYFDEYAGGRPYFDPSDNPGVTGVPVGGIITEKRYTLAPMETLYGQTAGNVLRTYGDFGDNTLFPIDSGYPQGWGTNYIIFHHHFDVSGGFTFK